MKSMKTLLRKILTPHPLRFEELYTALIEVEAILNSRPMTPLHSDDLQTFSYLTPGHFLIGRPLQALPTKPAFPGKITNLRRWTLVSRLTSNLWTKWKSIYLQSFAQRTKWFHPQQQPKIGQLIFLKDDTLKYRVWPLARITKLHAGEDDQIRAVDILCHDKEYTRPAGRLIPLLDENEKTPNSNSSSCPRRMSGTSSKTENTH